MAAGPFFLRGKLGKEIAEMLKKNLKYFRFWMVKLSKLIYISVKMLYN